MVAEKGKSGGSSWATIGPENEEATSGAGSLCGEIELGVISLSMMMPLLWPSVL